MKIVLYDGPEWKDLLPLTFTKPVAGLRIGIDTIREKWEAALNTECLIKTQDYLQAIHPVATSDDFLFINASYIPHPVLTDHILSIRHNQSLAISGQVIAYRTDSFHVASSEAEQFEIISISAPEDVIHICYPWDIFSNNNRVLQQDFDRITSGRVSAPISPTNRLLGERIFLEEGAIVECCNINTTTGPVYLGKNSMIMEGANIRGGLALCEESIVKMGAKLYGASTFGPHCKVGGEVNNSIFQGFSNKGHEGYLGNSVIGEWCNFGADTNASNLKNTYKKVKIYNYRQNISIDSGLLFLGLIMGDHSKSGINTMFNTGTVVGVFANIFGTGFPPGHIPSFSWGGAEHMEPYQFEKAIEVAEAVMSRKNQHLTPEYKAILRHIYDNTHHQIYSSN
ncbi:MAG TPA: putative sugar nucleotidyl transferase [Saprospiraceae bacterium]|mgnify:CR=1 FL=1|nr:putative sugar nucleotidyl transferase [Saprospiraceae bacterium]HRP85289.1 putative sugar nucleotidyl transferase [Saprospiraceae bacterium]